MADSEQQEALKELQKLNLALLGNADLKALELALNEASGTLRVPDAFYLRVLAEMQSRRLYPDRSPGATTIAPEVRALGSFMRVSGMAGQQPTFGYQPTDQNTAIGLNNGQLKQVEQAREPPAQLPRGGYTDQAFDRIYDDTAQRIQRESVEAARKLTYSEIADRLNRFYRDPSARNDGELGFGLFDVGGDLLALGRIVLIKDPTTGQLKYVSAAQAALLPASVFVSNAVLRQAIIDLASQLKQSQAENGFVEVPLSNTPESIGRVIVGGVIGGVVPDLPGGQLPPDRRPRQPVDRAGNVKPPGPFPDELFRRNPPDP